MISRRSSGVSATDIDARLAAIWAQVTLALASKEPIIPAGTFATPGQVDDAVRAIAGLAPSELDTLAEIAARIVSGESNIAAIASQIAGKQDIIPPGAYASPQDVAALQTALNGLYNEVQGKQPAGQYATLQALADAIAGRQPVGDYATNAALAYIADNTQPKGNYALSADVAAALATKQPAGDYATNAALNYIANNTQPKGDYATTAAVAYVADQVATKQAAGDYATNAALTSGLAGKQDKLTVTAPGQALLGAATVAQQRSALGLDVANVRTAAGPFAINDAYSLVAMATLTSPPANSSGVYQLGSGVHAGLMSIASIWTQIGASITVDGPASLFLRWSSVNYLGDEIPMNSAGKFPCISLLNAPEAGTYVIPPPPVISENAMCYIKLQIRKAAGSAAVNYNRVFMTLTRVA